jgi:hypothetical protein
MLVPCLLLLALVAVLAATAAALCASCAQSRSTPRAPGPRQRGTPRALVDARNVLFDNLTPWPLYVLIKNRLREQLPLVVPSGQVASTGPFATQDAFFLRVHAYDPVAGVPGAVQGCFYIVLKQGRVEAGLTIYQVSRGSVRVNGMGVQGESVGEADCAYVRQLEPVG